MTTYTLMHLLDAASYETVEAESPEDALDSSKMDMPTVCHHCAERVELSGEALKTLVLLGGQQVGESRSFQEQRIDELKALLRRCVTYAREDRMRTPGTTRLARALEEAEKLLGGES